MSNWVVKNKLKDKSTCQVSGNLRASMWRKKMNNFKDYYI